MQVSALPGGWCCANRDFGNAMEGPRRGTAAAAAAAADGSASVISWWDAHRRRAPTLAACGGAFDQSLLDLRQLACHLDLFTQLQTLSLTSAGLVPGTLISRGWKRLLYLRLGPVVQLTFLIVF